MTDQLSRQLGDGYDTCATSTTFYAQGDGSNLIFNTNLKASAITSVHNWVGGTTNDWAEKTVTTHYTANSDDFAKDGVIVTYESGNAPIAKVAQIDKLTFDTFANHNAGDHVIFYAQDGTAYGCWLKKVAAAVAKVETLTCAAKAAHAESDFAVVVTTAGNKYATWIDKTGSGTAPTSAKYTEVPVANRAKSDITSATTAADVATIVVAALNGITGFTDEVTLVDVGDGTITVTQDVAGASGYSQEYAAASTEAGSSAFTWSADVFGADEDVEPTNAAWVALPAAKKAVADISGDTTAANVATTARAAVAAITGIGTKITVSTVTSATFSLTQVTAGDCEDPVVANADGSDVGAITVENYTHGKTKTMKVVLAQPSNPMSRQLGDGM